MLLVYIFVLFGKDQDLNTAMLKYALGFTSKLLGVNRLNNVIEIVIVFLMETISPVDDFHRYEIRNVFIGRKLF